MKQQKIVILGGGESGAGAAILAKQKGFEVFLSDASGIKPVYKDLLDSRGIRWEENGHTEEEILAATEVIKSPGIPDKAPVIQKLKAQGTPILSEIEFAGRYTDARMICITGSNGKTTTTTLIHHIFTEAGLDASLAGNIGKSLALQVAEDPHAIYILELSSFQLDNMYDFRADTAILLNITPDHLDRYEYKMDNYANAKFRIIRNQRPEDAFIYWDRDPYIRKGIREHIPGAALYPFGYGNLQHAILSIDTPRGIETVAVDDLSMEGVQQLYNTLYPVMIDNLPQVVLSVDTPNGLFSMPVKELSLKGLHNVYNSLAAIFAAKIEGIEDDVIRRALKNFNAVEHRLEPVADIHGVHYINDSKATNVNSCYYALESMTTPVVLILGGTDKGNDYTEIDALVRQKARALVFLGVDNSKLHTFFGQARPTADAGSMEEAVEKATAFAQPGDTVLLSPCCASFDLFQNYEDRGRQFKEYVHKLKS
ncbi:MAG: UDP-N-acetylmuramoyl-L-alanine--D-glutamate ligase [Tannerellaceae bacterium]|nr:UDP-N-acetylmuramoyl-L-alanine--D-glutamate ligase [Tannerellaceae bacterium]